MNQTSLLIDWNFSESVWQWWKVRPGRPGIVVAVAVFDIVVDVVVEHL